MLYNKGDKIKIIVIEPWEHDFGSPAGIIYSIESGQLLIKLYEPLNGKKISSDYLRLSPRYKGMSFLSAQQNEPFFVNGSLFKEDSDLQEFIFSGELQQNPVLPGF